MKKLLAAAVVAIIVPCMGVGIAAAQEEGAPRTFIPVELNVCNYAEGKDREDYDRALGVMTEWMEDNESEPYLALLLSPAYAGDPEFDFVYVGAWPSGSGMGRDLAHWFATADDAIAAMDEATDCGVSAMFGGTTIKAPPEGPPPDEFMLSISDCTVEDGRTVDEALAALEEWGAYRDATGSPGGMFVWFPAYGDGEADYTFKLLNSHRSAEAFGDFWQWFVDNAAYRKQGELLGGLLSCDVPRMYGAELVVSTWPDDDGD